ncbi:MAG: GH25 family lysozyme [Massiliimalia sp.]|jgi:glucan-binding YG repeat protein
MKKAPKALTIALTAAILLSTAATAVSAEDIIPIAETPSSTTSTPEGWVPGDPIPGEENNSNSQNIQENPEGQWTKDSNGWHFVKADGTPYTGWISLNGVRYYLNESGIMLNGWFKIGNTWYYGDNNGHILTGWLKDGNTWYYLNADGSMATGLCEVNGVKYFLKSNGAMATGWAKDGDTWYYASGSGALQTGWALVNGKWYYLNSDCKMATGWVEVDGKKYFLDTSGAMKFGWIKQEENWYHLGSSGAMSTGWVLSGGKWYFLDPTTGWMVANGLFETDNGLTYNFDASGAMIGRAGGWVKEGNDWYYYKSGVKATGWVQSGGSWYYMGADGKMTTGWQTVNGKKYYLDGSNGGRMVTGTKTIDGITYNFDSSGAVINSSSGGNSGNNQGSISNAQWVNEGGKWYLRDTTNGANLTGWQKVGNTYYYMNSAGVMQTGWLKLNGTYYYLNASGAMATGWVQSGGSWYYMNSSGAMCTGWVQSGGQFYYLDPGNGGAMIANRTANVNGVNHTFNASGAATSIKRGIDVSNHQGTINWGAVKASGQADFAIIRDGYGKENAAVQTDKSFIANIGGAKSAGIPFGVYHFSYASSVEEAVQEANFCIQILRSAGINSDADMNLPVVYDVEDAATTGRLSASEITAVVNAFCDTLRANGYRTMVYANKTWFTSKMDFNSVASKNEIWLAQYNDNITFANQSQVDMWQYTSGGSVSGISGRVDMNVLFNPGLIH